MDRRVGTVSRGIRCPIIREGDDLGAIVAKSVIEAAEIEGFEFIRKYSSKKNISYFSCFVNRNKLLYFVK